jgi:hypothetical protein
MVLQPRQAQAAINSVPLPKLMQMRSRWLAYHLNAHILIILIQQPEPSGIEAGETWVRNRVQESLPTKHLTHAL